MNRTLIGMSLVLVLAISPFTDAKDSSSEGSNGSGIHGKIQSISNTLLSVGIGGGHGRRHHFLHALVVHYNPETTSVTLDGVPVQVLDASSIGKYVSVTGTMHDNQLEATSITVTTSAPSHPKKSKSKNT